MAYEVPMGVYGGDSSAASGYSSLQLCSTVSPIDRFQDVVVVLGMSALVNFISS